jgi:hemerythrin-like domain-containing protein
MNVVTLLERDHRKVEDLFARIEVSVARATKERLFQELRYELEAHATAEETVLYPRAARTADLENLAEHAIEEHEKVRTMMDDLARLLSTSGSLDDEELEDRLLLLKEAVEDHVEEEEAELFPELERRLNEAELHELGTDVLSAKQDLKKAG